MKITKVFAGETRLKDVYVGATKFQVIKYRVARFFKRLISVAAIASLTGWAILSGMHLAPEAVAVEVEQVVIPPVLERIAKCESPTGHFKDGQVVINGNQDKTSDIGKYQLNTVHSKEATKMGLDLTDEKDNETFALYLYATQGTEPWYASKRCWK